MKKIFDIIRTSSLWTGISSFFLLFFGVSGLVFASLGTCVLCIMPILTFFLAIFGLSMGVIVDYNPLFLGSGLFFLILTVYLQIRKRGCDTCTIPQRK